MKLGQITYTFVMIKNPKHEPKEPYLYFISDLKDARAIARHYLKRWKIECCFKNLKTNGFNVEDINLGNHQKIELMIGVLAILYLLALREGMLRHLLKPIALKKYNNGKTHLAISYFRLGNTIIQGLFNNTCAVLQYLQRLLKENAKLSSSVFLKNV